MTTSMERWSPSDFKDVVEKRIREVFVDLIPEEAFQKMVSDALDAFTTGKVINDKYWPSGLERLIEEMLKSEVRNQLRTMLQGDQWRVNYEGVVGEKLAEIVHQATPAIIQMWVTDLVKNIIERSSSTY